MIHFIAEVNRLNERFQYSSILLCYKSLREITFRMDRSRNIDMHNLKVIINEYILNILTDTK